MKKSLAIGLALAVGLVGSAAWAQCCPGSKAKAKASAEVCAKCGEVAKSAACCQADAERCPACGLHKGSPGCGAKCAPPAEPAS
ncbi:MAG TPA: hypothetical protein P5204_07015 [Kiritimatiellia bacterium]|nr:hypothetical protein [Kiritimatiellia bacterium]